MSRSIDLFIRSPKTIDEVGPEVARLTGLVFSPGQLPGTCSLDEGGVHAELRQHPYIDDGELLLERYQYALSARVPEGTRPADSGAASLLRVVSEALRKGGIESLLVHDLQYRDRGSETSPAGPAPEPVEPGAPTEGS